ncbi:MAG: hypothetical protein V1649_03705 [Patescibacteria group bacterium]
MIKASEIVFVHPTDHLETLRRCGGYYQCPKESDGKRKGPLIGYAGKYTAGDGSQKQWVGDVYANFAKAEEFPHVLDYFARQMKEELNLVLPNISVFCGAPIGGFGFAQALGLVFDRRVVKAEKKVIALGTADSREKSVLVFGRHGIETGDVIAVVEDVCNNFSTTDQLIQLIEGAGGQVSAIVCLLNRSLIIKDRHPIDGYNWRPVISLIRMSIPEYRQDDPAVVGDIATGNIVWKPKDEWTKLMTTMEANS